MSKYRAKPTVVEAFQFAVDPYPQWFKEAKAVGDAVVYPHDTIGKSIDPRSFVCEIYTVNGIIPVAHGDYIVMKPDEGFSVFSEKDFNEFYELV